MRSKQSANSTPLHGLRAMRRRSHLSSPPWVRGEGSGGREQISYGSSWIGVGSSSPEINSTCYPSFLRILFTESFFIRSTDLWLVIWVCQPGLSFPQLSEEVVTKLLEKYTGGNEASRSSVPYFSAMRDKIRAGVANNPPEWTECVFLRTYSSLQVRGGPRILVAVEMVICVYLKKRRSSPLQSLLPYRCHHTTNAKEWKSIDRRKSTNDCNLFQHVPLTDENKVCRGGPMPPLFTIQDTPRVELEGAQSVFNPSARPPDDASPDLKRGQRDKSSLEGAISLASSPMVESNRKFAKSTDARPNAEMNEMKRLIFLI
ncbi:hypothetical protein CDAR_396001 [Caerostris darwini]|uniref:Uncharacterized protein n=1 Tax=Caerostris darwini TaxID=1538125 RepID=A0AAV4WN67_9ARAC|nr:hypothetical protein CDAR_396001 [Caerostris darwini]